MSTLLDLPTEILALLPRHFNNIETFVNASSTCRRLRSVFANALPSTILSLAAASAPIFFSPHPYFLVTAIASQLRDWALGNEENTRRLREAFQGGIEGLYEFCLNDRDLNAGITMDRIRVMYEARFAIINPLSDKIDKMAGSQWYQSVPNFWDGGVSEPGTLYTEPDRAAFQILTYGELFGSSLCAFLEHPHNAEKRQPAFDVDTRLDYVKYIIPDWICRCYPGFGVLPTGPYTKGEKRKNLPADQISMRHILTCRRWRRMWIEAMEMVGPLFAPRDAERDEFEPLQEGQQDHPGVWKLKLFRDGLITMGMQGFMLVTVPKEKIPAKVLEKARRIRGWIEALEEPFPKHFIHERLWEQVSIAPDPSTDIYVCMAPYRLFRLGNVEGGDYGDDSEGDTEDEEEDGDDDDDEEEDDEEEDGDGDGDGDDNAGNTGNPRDAVDDDDNDNADNPVDDIERRVREMQGM
ncbi:hypothetical protein AJ79_03610 [Helicocarpus griseus UAMH5409]|uniref:F-box domain-containing protein n=1 Tax=Helicocarpus griseus UAMH5409 TaxID=1447875 RepID=A0A2B7XWU7_9EURO|nr:hypothetical protein AJ79_03610 [Helicocarpus griseus UAMH5409]